MRKRDLVGFQILGVVKSVSDSVVKLRANFDGEITELTDRLSNDDRVISFLGYGHSHHLTKYQIKTSPTYTRIPPTAPKIDLQKRPKFAKVSRSKKPRVLCATGGAPPPFSRPLERRKIGTRWLCGRKSGHLLDVSSGAAAKRVSA